jgi:hypothetical protein
VEAPGGVREWVRRVDGEALEGRLGWRARAGVLELLFQSGDGGGGLFADAGDELAVDLPRECGLSGLGNATGCLGERE